jgi:ATP-binding cassette, subfamily B, bacterial PglK
VKPLKKLFDLLSPPERKQAGLLSAMMLVVALLDMLSVASIMPFMAVLANPGLLQSNEFLAWFYQHASAVGISGPEQFLLVLGVLVFVVLLSSLAFKALTAYAQTRFSLMREYSICRRLVEGYLQQPYSWFLSRHSADLGQTILSEVNMVMGQALTPVMQLVAQSAVMVALVALLLLVDPALALAVGVVLGAAYSIVFKLMAGFLARTGGERVEANRGRYRAVSEAFGAAKEVKVGGLEKVYVKRFAAPARRYAKHQASAQVVGQLPGFALEALAFGGMILLVLVLMTRSGSFASVLPIIALYAFAGYRMMPALHVIYSALTQLRYAGAALDALHAEFMGLQAPVAEQGAVVAMALRQAITLNSVHYSYPNASEPTLRGVSLTIHAHSVVGLVGATGSGKTTTVDVILGLLETQHGMLTVDGTVIDASNRRQWQRAIGYVPQHIYLADDTVTANIALGVEDDAIDHAAVERAARIANLHSFVSTELPLGYATCVGERGVRLSGGQRQRIGIARALYRNPQVLILDEATSALDTLTEQAVMDAVHNLGNKITIVLIAHRLSTVRQCDQIFMLDKGQVQAQGTYAELVERSDIFRAMAFE